jgi:type II secretory pathway component PulF
MADQDKHGAVRWSTGEAVHLSEQIAGLTRAGLPLPSGLRALGAELPGGRLRRLLDEVSLSLEAGASLDEALGAEGRGLPAHLRGLVRAGERTGRTGEVLGRFAGYANIGADVRRQLWLSLAYPLVAMAMAVTVLLFVLTFIVGGFEQIFRDFGIPLPTLSLFLIAVSVWLLKSGAWLIAGLVALGAIGGVTMVVIGPAARRSVASRLPLLGPVWRWTSLAEFCHLLGLLLEGELPLVEAVPLAGEGVADRDIRKVARGMTQDLDRGDSLAAAIGRRSLFPEGLGQIVAWAELHECLAKALHMMAEMFEGRARAQASFASTVCSVLTVILILGGIAAVIVGVLAPMIILIQKLSG